MSVFCQNVMYAYTPFRRSDCEEDTPVSYSGATKRRRGFAGGGGGDDSSTAAVTIYIPWREATGDEGGR